MSIQGASSALVIKLIQELQKLVQQFPILTRLSIDSAGRLRIIIDAAGTATPITISAGTARIGYVGITEKLLATPYTDSTTALGINGVFTGTSRDTQIDSAAPYCYYSKFRAHAVSDQAGTLMVQESPDGATWVTVKNVATVVLTNPDGTTVQVAYIEHTVVLRYVRVAYRNGATAQTTFRLSSRLC